MRNVVVGKTVAIVQESVGMAAWGTHRKGEGDICVRLGMFAHRTWLQMDRRNPDTSGHTWSGFALCIIVQPRTTIYSTDSAIDNRHARTTYKTLKYTTLIFAGFLQRHLNLRH